MIMLCLVLAPNLTDTLFLICRKFGKQIQKAQLGLPEYVANFLNYKALKKVCAILDFSKKAVTSDADL